jgi:hypothetical protein
LKPSILNSNSTKDLSEINLESDFCFLEPDSVDLGSSFQAALEASSLSASEKTEMKIRGKTFLKEVFIGFQGPISETFYISNLWFWQYKLAFFKKTQQ